MRSGRNNDRERLEREILGETYTSLLLSLQQTDGFLRRFRTWADTIVFMRQGSSEDPRKDEVLRPILRAHAIDRDPRWLSVLLAIFWPGLGSIANRKAGWDADADERWQNVVWAFLQTVCKLDPAKRPDRLVQKIINDTFHRFHEEYQRSWNRSEREVATDPKQFEDQPSGDDDLVLDQIDRRFRQEAEIKRLQEHMEAGRISEADFLLLIGTRVYGKSAAEYAREIGVNGELTRKRRLRAEATIRKFEKKSKSMSRSIAPAPLSLGRGGSDRQRRTHR